MTTLVAGVDVGVVSSQAVVLRDGAFFAVASLRTGAGRPESARAVLERAMRGTGLTAGDLQYIVGTGRGRVPQADRTISAVHCHARGAHHLFGDQVRTVLDVGGQGTVAIRCDDRGRVQISQVSDKCASGTGLGLEVLADVLQVPLDRVGPLSLAVDEEPPPPDSECAVYSRREALARLRQGWEVEEVLAAWCGALARSAADLLERVGVEPGLAITGGMAHNPGVVRRLEAILGLEVLGTDLDPQLAGALGAALFAARRAEKRASSTLACGDASS